MSEQTNILIVLDDPVETKKWQDGFVAQGYNPLTDQSSDAVLFQHKEGDVKINFVSSYRDLIKRAGKFCALALLSADTVNRKNAYWGVVSLSGNYSNPKIVLMGDPEHSVSNKLIAQYNIRPNDLKRSASTEFDKNLDLIIKTVAAKQAKRPTLLNKENGPKVG